MSSLPTPNAPRAPWNPTTPVDLPSSTVTGSAQFRIIAAVRAQSVLLGFSLDTLCNYSYPMVPLSSLSRVAMLLQRPSTPY